MFEIVVTEEFQSRYALLSLQLKRKAEKQEKFFRQNPFYPSLHTEKLEPKGKELWSFRVDKSYRILFRFLKNRTAIFLTVGPHDWIYEIAFKRF
jgi:plasmid maintenance system killer protein